MLVRTGIERAAYFVEGFCKTITETKPVVIRVSLFAFMKVTISIIWFDILNLMACARFGRTNAERIR